MKGILIVTLALLAFAIADDLRSQFTAFQTKYNKVYRNDAEFHRRFKIFQVTLQLIYAHDLAKP